jgi:hypothetical protein
MPSLPKINLPHTGAWGTPDFGITEKLQSVFQASKPLTGDQGSNLFGAAKPAPSGTPVVGPTTSPTPTGTGGSGGKVLGATTTAQRTATPTSTFDPEAESRAAADRARAETEGNISREREAIAGEFDPIFGELDRQIGMLPQQKQELETQLANLAGIQKEGVTASEARGITELDKSGETEKATAKSSLRNLEEDVRNLLQAKQFYFGSVGAGDSSATGQASEAVSKGALRARGGVLAARDSGLALIETKKQDVRSLAGEQSRKIDEWKSEKMFGIAQEFQEKTNQLNMAKANATGAKAKAINDVIRGLSQDLSQQLRSLDDRTYQFKSSVANWQMQREAELEDYKTKLSLTQSYSSAAGPKYSDALNSFTKIYGTGALSVGDARQAASDQYGIDPLSGLEIGADVAGTKKKSLSDLLGDQALAEVFAGQN